MKKEIWLGNSKKLICIDESRFYMFSHLPELKNISQLQNIFSFLTINHLEAESHKQQGIFLHVIPVSIIVSCFQASVHYQKSSL